MAGKVSEYTPISSAKSADLLDLTVSLGGGAYETRSITVEDFKNEFGDMTYRGDWNANTNTPALADGTGTKGDLYRVSVAGSQDLGGGSISFSENNNVAYAGSVWVKFGATGSSAIGGEDGEVVLSDGAGQTKTSSDLTFLLNSLSVIGKLEATATDGTQQKLLELLDSGGIEQYSIDSEGIVRQRAGGTTPVAELDYGTVYYNDIDDTYLFETTSEVYVLNTDTIERLKDTSIGTKLQADAILFDKSLEKWVNYAQYVDASVLSKTELAITGASPYEVELVDSVEGGYSIHSFLIENLDAVNSVSVVLSTSAGGGGDVMTSKSIPAGETLKFEGADFVKRYFDNANDTPIYIELTSAGTPSVNILKWTTTTN